MSWKIFPHFLFLVSLLYCYRFNNGPLPNFTGSNVTSKAPTTRRAKLIDYLSPAVLELEISTFLYWATLASVLIYSVYLLYKLYQALVGTPDIIFRPADRDVGYLVTAGKTKRDIANMVRKRRVIGDIPPPYPNGWYEVMRSVDLPIGASKAISMLGQHFAVFRNHSGQVSVTDAYCPHLGANLGVGGRVIGNCIECPFHGWQFDGETGQCTSIPYSTSKVPSFAKIKVWPSLEVNELILVWYDAEGREPYFTIPEIPQIKSGRWVFRGRSVHYLNCHIEDIPENGADIAHLNVVHDVGSQTGINTDYRRSSSWLGKLMTHEWTANWEPLPPPNEHIGHLNVKVITKLFGYFRFKLMELSTSVDQIGPGFVILRISNFMAEVILLHSLVPEGPMQQRLTCFAYSNWWLPAFISHFILYSHCIQFERDALVWVNKRYMGKPALVKEDQLISAHRRWFKQFYSEHSVRMTSEKSDTDLSW